MKKRVIAAIMTIAMLVTLLVGCSGKEVQQSSTADSDAVQESETESKEAPAKEEEKEPVTLEFWYSCNNTEADEPKAEWYEDTVALFEEKYPWITIEATGTPGGDYLTKVTTEVSAGNSPDVFTAWMTGRLQPFVEGGHVMPLNDVVANSEVLSAAITDIAKTYSQYGDDKFYAIPRELSGEAIFYNKTIFEECGVEVPTTIEEFDQVCATLMEKGVRPLASGGGGNTAWVASIAYMSIFQQLDKNDEMYNKVVVNNEACFDDPFFVEVAEKYMEYYDKGYYNDNYEGVTYEEAKVLFENREVAMMFDGLWSAGQFAAMEDEIGVFNYPGVDGPSTEMLVNYDGGICISSKTEHPEEAALFLEFLFSEERQIAWAENVNCLLATPGVPYDKSKVDYLNVEVEEFLNSATSANIPWDNPLGINMGNEFNNTVQSIMFGADPAEAFQALNETAKLEWGE